MGRAPELVFSDQQTFAAVSEDEAYCAGLFCGRISPSESLDDYVLKPLYSFAGLGVDMEPTTEKLARSEKPHEWILQKKVNYADFVPTSTAEIESGNPDDVSSGRTDGEPMLVNNLVRMSQGKMMGVDFNKEKTWVGSSIALHA